MTLLLFANGLLAVTAAGLTALAPSKVRTAVRLLALTGAAACAGLFLGRETDWAWRALTAQPPTLAVAAIGAATAWLAVAARPSAMGAVAVGVGTFGTIGFACARWVVPAALYWVAATAGLALAARRAPGRSWTWAALGLSDAALLVALILERGTGWTMPQDLGGAGGWIVIGALVLRAGAVAGAGPWALAGSDGAGAAPLLVASGFCLAPLVLGAGSVGAGSALLGAALGWATLGALRDDPPASIVGAWFAAVMLACSFLAPEATARAGVAAVLACGLLVLWPAAAGRAQAERALFLAIVPATAGFGAVVAASRTAFERATAPVAIGEVAPWAFAAGLLPVALSLSVALAGRLARRRELESFSPAAVVASWALVAVGVGFGLAPQASLSLAGAGRAPVLYGVALAAALLAGRRAVRCGATVAPLEASGAPRLGVWPGPRPLQAGAAVLGAMGWAGAVAAVGWLTFQGLKVGFL